jgi:hypothetical protein
MPIHQLEDQRKGYSSSHRGSGDDLAEEVTHGRCPVGLCRRDSVMAIDTAGVRTAAAVLQRATALPWRASASRRRPPRWSRCGGWWRAGRPSRGCGGVASRPLRCAGCWLRCPRAAARPAMVWRLIQSPFFASRPLGFKWHCPIEFHCPAAVLPALQCACTGRMKVAPKATSPSPAALF